MGLDVIACGFPMVELYRKYPDQPLNQNGEFIGPFAAGDPAIAVSACIKQGYTGGYVGVTGKDRFADCFFAGMQKNKVDVSHVRVDPTRTTGISLLAKFNDNRREFLFTLRDSAAATLGPDDYDPAFFNNTKWFHVSGAALSISDSILALHEVALSRMKDSIMVSFDPNYRDTLIEMERYKKVSAAVFRRCNLFLPSMGEASIFCPEAADEFDACRRIAAAGKMVALKDGSTGAYGFLGDQEVFIPAYKVEEIDPTGAGDTFGGALMGALLSGYDFFAAVRYGAAAGALAVNRMGLMEDVPGRAEIQAIMAQQTQHIAHQTT